MAGASSHMRPSKRCTDLIKHFEGVYLKPYICPAGYWTIGVGHLITHGEAAKYALGITQQQCDNLLASDLSKCCVSVERLINVKLTQGQFDALVSFVFNLGHGRLHASSLRAKINRGDMDGAANEFGKWTLAGGRRLAGLVRRREAERLLFVS